MNLSLLNIQYFAPVRSKEELQEIELPMGVKGAALWLTKLEESGESHVFYNHGNGWEDAVHVVTAENIQPSTLVQIRLKNGAVTYGYQSASGTVVVEQETPQLDYTGHHYQHQILYTELICKFRM